MSTYIDNYGNDIQIWQEKPTIDKPFSSIIKINVNSFHDHDNLVKVLSLLAHKSTTFSIWQSQR